MIMGLDTTHEAWHGPCSAFNDWRRWVAQKALGMDLDKMEGFCDGGFSWSHIKHPLVPLLNHSDCDGVLPLAALKEIADSLMELATASEEPPKRHSNEWYCLRFADGCQAAIKAGEDIKFG